MSKMRAVLTVNGAHNFTQDEREPNDYYATDPNALRELLKRERFATNIWECACGGGHLSRVLEDEGYIVKSTDLFDRGYGTSGVDFLSTDETFDGDIITNPPYNRALEFVQKAIKTVPEGNRVAMFLKLTFLEGQRRRLFFEENPPEYIYVSTTRVRCALGGNFENLTGKSSAVAYAWFIWRKGYKGEPKVRWFN